MEEYNELDELYQSLVLEHSKKPRNYGKLSCSCQMKGKNPSCGDEINLYISIENDLINDIKFEGQGCALSIASTSIMTEELKNKNKVEALNIISSFINFITKEESINNNKLNVLGGVKKFPLRVKCVLLGWRASEKILTTN